MGSRHSQSTVKAASVGDLPLIYVCIFPIAGEPFIKDDILRIIDTKDALTDRVTMDKDTPVPIFAVKSTC